MDYCFKLMELHTLKNNKKGRWSLVPNDKRGARTPFFSRVFDFVVNFKSHLPHYIEQRKKETCENEDFRRKFECRNFHVAQHNELVLYNVVEKVLQEENNKFNKVEVIGESRMRLRPYIPLKDYECLQSWINDERTHALWCANLISYPMTSRKLQEMLEKDAQDWGGCAYIVTEDDGKQVGFFVLAVNVSNNSGFLKFVVVDKKGSVK